uniref:Nanos-type domain-containing protein n=1 Tax=viral metagenome TaxID=1070528 RepID=A0A6C0E0Z6_9ZZZZ
MSSRKQEPTTTVKKPYCKVCHDAGKPESVYTSHYVKTSLVPNAKIACPTLLALECKYCFNPGHTVKYCAVLKKNEKAKRTQVFKKKEEDHNQKKIPMSGAISNVFAALDLCDYEEEEKTEDQEVVKQTVVKEEFPQLNASKMENKIQKATATVLSFASVAYLAQAKEEECMLKQYEKELQYEEEEQKKRTYQVIVPEPLMASKMNWADYDTESELDSDTDF